MLYLHSFTGIYKQQNFYKDFKYVLFDDEEVSGVRGYMDDDARNYLMKEIQNKGELLSVHFLDSGNYHHLSRLYLDLIEEPFNLVVYDNHTDMQFSPFGNILSCGSWIADAYETHKKLNKVFMIGVGEKYIDTCELKNDERIIFADNIYEVNLDDSLPIYISVDKDVISDKEFVSDWDQGGKLAAALIEELESLINKFKVLGVDICGEPKVNDSINIKLSNNINKEITNIFVDILC